MKAINQRLFTESQFKPVATPVVAGKGVAATVLPAILLYSYLRFKISETNKKKMLFFIFLGIDTTISSIQILETQQRIDSRYCKNPQCR